MSANVSTSTIMEVDSPVSLKRSNSAPMINELNNSMSAASAGSSVPSAVTLRDVSQHRTRRFSGSFSPHHSAGSSPRPSPRVSQLRQEECLDVVGREAAHEKELHSAMQMSQSCEDLTIVTESLSCSENESSSSSSDRRISSQRLMDPLHVNLPQNSPSCSSPSPTRSALGRCSVFGPWKSNLSPSPTRSTFTTRRSLSPSPITMRPSSLGQPVKRKFDLEEEKSDHYVTPPAKRSSVFVEHPMSSIGSGLLMTQPQRLEQGSSPQPTSLSSAGTPDSLSSADSPSFTYRLDSPSPARALTGPAEHSPS